MRSGDGGGCEAEVGGRDHTPLLDSRGDLGLTEGGGGGGL